RGRYEVLFQVAAGQSERDTWHLACVSTRSEYVSTRSECPARQEEEKRIAKEKEVAELEAKCKIQECLNIEEKSIPQASTRSRKFRFDPTLSNFTVHTKSIPFSKFNGPPVETVNSLSMGDKHLDTSKDSLESSVKDP
ncbi:hypothetical protein Tco_0165906, partial [Tanacetum coccineum]